MLIEDKNYTFDEILDLFFFPGKYKLSIQALESIQKSREFLLKNLDKRIYGLNTGFGPMTAFSIDSKDFKKSQKNLIFSHAVGMGRRLPAKFSKFILIGRLAMFAKGYSAISLELAERIIFFLNNKIYPIITEHGGVGASGDLVQLSQVMKGLLGKGKAYYNKKIVNIQKLKLPAYEIQTRDGLAFINGTTAMTVVGIYNIFKAQQIIQASISLSSVLYEIFNTYDDQFSTELNSFKHHPGQRLVSKIIVKNLCDSKLLSKRFQKNSFSPNFQEIYSLRCVPQIIGPIVDALNNSKKVLVDEFNSISDNPIFDYKNEKIFFGGNFHGDYVSFEMDKLKIAMTKLSLLLNKQLVLLLNDRLNKKFPPFQNYKKLGLDLGLQGLEFVSASTAAESQTLSYPNYLHNITSNNDNQDIVSMGFNSALLCEKVIKNCREIFSITALAVMYAIKFNGLFENLSTSNKNFLLKLGYESLKYDDTKISNDLKIIKKNLRNNFFKSKLELLK